MSQKQYYIDDFKVRNCTQYGQYEIIDNLNSGDRVCIGYDPDEKVIVVTTSLEGKGKPFGELEVPEQMRKILVPLLQGLPGSKAFICKMNIADKKVVINERLQVSVWAANKEAEGKKEEKKKSPSKSKPNTK